MDSGFDRTVTSDPTTINIFDGKTLEHSKTVPKLKLSFMKGVQKLINTQKLKSSGRPTPPEVKYADRIFALEKRGKDVDIAI